jgi:hypothetical protein
LTPSQNPIDTPFDPIRDNNPIIPEIKSVCRDLAELLPRLFGISLVTGKPRRMEGTMKTRSLILGALGAVFIMGAAAPAFADRDGWRGRGWREHEWREHEWREHHYWRPGYYAAPTYYAPPPVYYAPPPVYYAPPVIGFGINIR